MILELYFSGRLGSGLPISEGSYDGVKKEKKKVNGLNVKCMRSLMLVVLCLLCLVGTCLANDKKDNWVFYYSSINNNTFFVDTNSLKVVEYNGRKYLETRSKRKEEGEEFYLYFSRTITKTTAEWHQLFDISQGKQITLDYYDKSDNSKGTNDITAITNGRNITEIDERELEWIASNYPPLVDEIMSYNHDKSLRSPLGKTECIIKKNTTGVGGAYMIQSDDGLMGLTFDYKPESNMFLMYDLNESSPYSSMKFNGWNEFKRNSTDMYDSYNGEYVRSEKDNLFKQKDNEGYRIFSWETNSLLVFLRTKAWKYL